MECWDAGHLRKVTPSGRSNRVGVFDEAFQSCIHVSLHYNPLNQRQMLKVWLNNLVFRIRCYRLDSHCNKASGLALQHKSTARKIVSALAAKHERIVGFMVTHRAISKLHVPRRETHSEQKLAIGPRRNRGCSQNPSRRCPFLTLTLKQSDIKTRSQTPALCLLQHATRLGPHRARNPSFDSCEAVAEWE